MPKTPKAAAKVPISFVAGAIHAIDNAISTDNTIYPNRSAIMAGDLFNNFKTCMWHVTNFQIDKN